MAPTVGPRRITYDGWKEIERHKTSSRDLQERKAEEGRVECIRDRTSGGP